MTIEDAVKHLKMEQAEAIPFRFPCRAILVSNLTEYCKLINLLFAELNGLEIVPMEALFAEADVLPAYENLKTPDWQNRWLLLTGVGEYLRLFHGAEKEHWHFSKLWKNKFPTDDTGRIIMPLWGCETIWYDAKLAFLSDERSRERCFFDCMDPFAPRSKLSLQVLSGKFEQYMEALPGQAPIFYGIREYFNYWASPDPKQEHLILMTGRWRGISAVTGDCSIRVIPDRLAFIRENLPGSDTLDEANCPPEAQELLFARIAASADLKEAVFAALNRQKLFDLEGWDNMAPGQRQLALLWLRLHPDGSYLSHCAAAARTVSELEAHILSDIFPLRLRHPQWVAESQALIKAMGLRRDADYFRELDRISAYEERLDYLTNRTAEERIYLLRMVGQWLRQDFHQVTECTRLETVSPELSAYLDVQNATAALSDEALRRYFLRYKSYKLSNTLPEDEKEYFGDVRREDFDFRYTALNHAIDDDTVVLWVDGLGAEWLPLLLWAIKKLDFATVTESSVTQANVPTETKYNRQWEQMSVPYKKRNKLDKLAHKGVVDDPDYYACLEEEIAFVSKLPEMVGEWMRKYHRVILTGDHGTSRLAARFFHVREGFPAPSGAVVGSHGRYCRLAEDCKKPELETLQEISESGERYLVFTNYDHFTQSGLAARGDDEKALYGEIHGGAAPEECLVPVIVVDSRREIPLTAEWEKNPVKIRRKQVKAILKFSRPVSELQVHAADAEIVLEASADRKRWTLVFSETAPGTCSPSIVADGKLLTVDALNILPALGEEELFT